jgi:hypothetical protein
VEPEPIVVSEETTIYTEPLRPDGTVDYAAALNAKYGKGVTAENNLAVGLLDLYGVTLLGEAESLAELRRIDPGFVRRVERLLETKLPETPVARWTELDAFVEALPDEKLPEAYREIRRAQATERAAWDEQLPGWEEFEESAEPPSFAPRDMTIEEGEVIDLDKSRHAPALTEAMATGWRRLEALARARYDVAMQRPWKRDEFPALAMWLDANAEALDGLADLAGRERYHWPVVVAPDECLVDASLFDLWLVRQGARALCMRALLRAGQGHRSQAIDELGRVLRIGRTLDQGRWIIERVVGASIVDQAASSLGQIVMGDITPGELRQVIQVTASLPGVGPSVQRVRDETLALHDVIQGLATGRGEEGWALQQRPEIDTSLDWTRMLRRATWVVDNTGTSVAGNDPYTRRRMAEKSGAAFQQLTDEMLEYAEFIKSWVGQAVLVLSPASYKRRVGSDAIWWLLVTIMTPSVENFPDIAEETAVRVKLVHTAAGLRLTQLQTGRLAESLDEVSEHLVLAADDPFARGPLTYSKTDEGFLLYSWAGNLADDGGDEYDDLVIRYPPREVEVSEPSASFYPGAGYLEEPEGSEAIDAEQEHDNGE